MFEIAFVRLVQEPLVFCEWDIISLQKLKYPYTYLFTFTIVD